MSNQKPKAQKKAYIYVNKHGFDDEIRNTCWACYHDGFIDAQSQLQELRDATLDLEPEMSNTTLIRKEDVLNLIDKLQEE